MLFHITARSDWEQAKELGYLHPSSLDAEGFIHLSTEMQWPQTAVRFFRGRLDLVLLTIDPTRLSSDVRYEAADDDRFPHLYGRMEASAVTEVATLVPDAEGLLRVATRETL